MSELSIKGKITHILDARGGTSQKTGKEWKVQSYVLETEGQYPKHICFDVWNDDISKFGITQGKTYEVNIDIDADEYQGRWYNKLKAWKVTEQSDESASNEAEAEPQPIPPAKVDEAMEEPSSDLPF